MLVLLLVVAAGLLALGLYLLIRRWRYKGRVSGGNDKWFFSMPVPLFLILLAIALPVLAYWQLDKRFPAGGEEFFGAPRTLGSIADGLRRNSGVDIQLVGDAETVVISQRISAACATAFMNNLCDRHLGTLTCSQKGSRWVIERSR